MDDVFAAELASRNARAALLAWMNAPDLTPPFDVAEPLQPRDSGASMPTALSSPLNSTDLGRRAVGARPDILAAGREVARADTETQLQRALRTPNVTVGGGYKRDFGTNAVVFGVTVPLPLFTVRVDSRLGIWGRRAAVVQYAKTPEKKTLIIMSVLIGAGAAMMLAGHKQYPDRPDNNPLTWTGVGFAGGTAVVVGLHYAFKHPPGAPAIRFGPTGMTSRADHQSPVRVDLPRE